MTNKILYCSAAIICGFSILTAFRPAPQEDSVKVCPTQWLVDSIGSAEPMSSSLLGVFAVKGNSDTLVSYNPHRKLMPASNNKLITTGIAMLQLGPDWQYSTSLQTDADICNGELAGDLYIVGTGDPTIGAGYEGTPELEETFAGWKAILDSLGIRRINGKIVGDGRFFNGESIPESWEIFDLGYDYFGACEALNVYENIVRLKVPGGTAPGKRISGIIADNPQLPWLNVESEAFGEDGQANRLYAIPSILKPYAVVRGTLGVKRKESCLEINNSFPAYTCAQLFHDYLVENGIQIGGGYADISPCGNVRSDLGKPDEGPQAQTALAVLGSTESIALKQIIADCNRESDNFYAETLLRTVGKDITGASDYRSCSAARDSMFVRLGLTPAEGYELVDGSGLSRHNYVAPEFLVRFLSAMRDTPIYRDYLESLPQPGFGTLKPRIKDEPDSVKTRVFMKSGSFEGTICFSGYILAEDGNPDNTIVFSIMSNNVAGPASRQYLILESIIQSLAHEN